ncbi:MAG: AAA family ATPase [Nanoarchaeota archaeon]|nr:AAA family ATPase [Nanoarchaeota archaeon]
MKIKKIELNNIRSYEKETIEFPSGSTVLAGDIGTGKTSVLLAIEFALFGLQPGQRGSSLLKNGKKEGSVILEIEIDNKNIIIERGLKRGKTVNQTNAKIEINGEKKDLSVTELKNKVLEFLNYPKEFAKKTNILYRFTVYTPQEEMKQIILESSQTRLNTLRHIFGIDKYKKIEENIEILISKLREKIKNYEGQIIDFEELKERKNEKIQALINLEVCLKKISQDLYEKEEQRKIAEEKLKEIEEKIKEKEKFEKEIEKTKIMLIGKRELIERINNEKNLLLREVEEAKKISFSPEEIEKTESQTKINETELEEENKIYMEILSSTNSINSRISESIKLKEQISTLKLCPTCLQDVNEDYKKNIIREKDDSINKFEKQLKEQTTLKEKILININLIKNKIYELNKKTEELKLLKIKSEGTKEKEGKILDFEKQNSSAEKDISLLEKQIERLKESSFILNKYENIYKENKKEIEKSEELKKQKEIEFATYEKEKEITTKIAQEIELEISKKQEIKNKLLKLKELEDWILSSFLSVIRFTEKSIMLKLKDEFSKLFNEWFNILVPEDFIVHLDEDFTPIIENKDYQLDYSFLSGGERTSIALAYRLALNQIINSLLSKIKTRDLVILDEPTDGFSELQLNKMRDVLNELNVSQLIIVSHEQKIESFVDNIIRFRKEGGITIVES